jgi:hypothetical protein
MTPWPDGVNGLPVTAPFFTGALVPFLLVAVAMTPAYDRPPRASGPGVDASTIEVMAMPIQEIGVSGRHAGRVVGLIPALEHAAQFGPSYWAVGAHALRGFNDMPEGHILGSSGGRLVVRHIPGPADLGSESEEEFAARARQAGQENRAYYHDVVGTPKRPPRRPWGGEPEAESPQRPKPKSKWQMETGDLRRRTP